MLILQVMNKVLSVIFYWLWTENASEYERVKQMLVCNVNVFLYWPRLVFASWASIISTTRNNLVICVTKNSFTFLALSWIVKWNAVADGTGYQFMFEKWFLKNPFLINCYKFGFTLHFFVLGYLFFSSLLHAIKIILLILFLPEQL